MNEEIQKPELQLEPLAGELQPVGKMPTLTGSEVKAIAILLKVGTVETLANQSDVNQRIDELKIAYSQDIEKTKSCIGDVKTMAEFKRADSLRLSIREKRLEFSKTADTALKQNKSLVDNAKIGKVAVEDFLKSIESDLESALSDKESELKAESARKKALADALEKLKSHTINPLLPTADIETAIDDFRLSFGDTDYQESQSIAESIFESKITEFESIMAAAVVREQNEAAVKLENARNQQRSNIGITFPIAEISDYAARSAADIQARIDRTAKVDMTSFELVLLEADAQKHACFNMLAAFLPMAVAREAKEAADKAETNRVSAIKSMIKNIADRPSDFIGQKSSVILQCLNGLKQGIEVVWNGDFAEFKNEAELTLADAIERLTVILNGTLKKEATEKQYQDDWDLAIEEGNERKLEDREEFRMQGGDMESAATTIINDDVIVPEDVAEIINDDAVGFIDSTEIPENKLAEWHEMLEDDVVSDPLEALEVVIPVKHLRYLIYAADVGVKQGIGLRNDKEVANAIEFAKSLL